MIHKAVEHLEKESPSQGFPAKTAGQVMGSVVNH